MGTVLGPMFCAFVVKRLDDKLGDLGELLAATTGLEWFKSIGESVTFVTAFIFVICVLLRGTQA